MSSLKIDSLLKMEEEFLCGNLINKSNFDFINDILYIGEEGLYKNKFCTKSFALDSKDCNVTKIEFNNTITRRYYIKDYTNYDGHQILIKNIINPTQNSWYRKLFWDIKFNSLENIKTFTEVGFETPVYYLMIYSLDKSYLSFVSQYQKNYFPFDKLNEFDKRRYFKMLSINLYKLIEEGIFPTVLRLEEIKINKYNDSIFITDTSSAPSVICRFLYYFLKANQDLKYENNLEIDKIYTQDYLIKKSFTKENNYLKNYILSLSKSEKLNIYRRILDIWIEEYSSFNQISIQELLTKQEQIVSDFFKKSYVNELLCKGYKIPL